MKSQNEHVRPRLRRLVSVVAAVTALAIPLAACSDVLDVNDPDVIGPGQLDNETAIPAIHGSAIAALRDAYDDYNGQILYSGLLADEFLHSGTFPTRLDIDQRHISETNGTLADVTRNLFRARTATEDAVAKLTDLGADANTLGEVQALAGYTYVLFAENYCSGIPFSELTPADTIAYGQPNTTSEVLQNYAIPHFDAVLNNAEIDDASVINLARVGKARALLDLGHYGEAAAVAADVPEDFLYMIGHTTNTGAEYNGVYAMTWSEGRMSSWSEEGGNGLPYLEGKDPRTAVYALPAAYSFDGDTPLNLPLIYQSRDESTILASGVEAQLILAENALQHNNPTGMVDILNDLRANVMDFLTARQPTYSVTLTDFGYPTDLPPIASVPSTKEEQTDLLFQERGFWLYLTAHRLGDMRRLLRQYGRAEDVVYPTGEYFRTGGQYGEDVSLRIPVDEENNQNYDLSMCVSTAAGEEAIPTVLGAANP